MFDPFYLQKSLTKFSKTFLSRQLDSSCLETFLKPNETQMGWYVSINTVSQFKVKQSKKRIIPQIREQMSGPDLHVVTLKFLALKN